ncbi:MAG TPA: hypothetical protein VFE52_06005 [Devosia sp.]|jgi:hypothetical protein|nr:hypothetical protein [Devosia sp.]
MLDLFGFRRRKAGRLTEVRHLNRRMLRDLGLEGTAYADPFTAPSMPTRFRDPDRR